MKLVSVKLPETLEKQATTYAARRGKSKSAVVREALEAFLSRKAGPRIGSLLARAGDLAGRVAGPNDLSSAKRHLRRYGQ